MKKLNEMQDNVQYRDDVYMELSNEFEQVRKALGMYIGPGETDGALHLCKEIMNNAIDECVNPESPSKKIYVTFDEEKCEFTVTDEGRGIPFDLLASISTKKHTSTKFVRTEPWMKGQAGRNGVGIVVTAALSDYMSLTSYRKNEYKIVEFIDGKMEEHNPEKNKKNQTGLSVKLIPSEKYLGKIDLDIELIEDFLRRMTYLLPEDISIVFYGESPKYDKPIKRKYNYQGLHESVNFLSTSLEFEPVTIEYEEDDFDLFVSFSYDKTLDGMIMDSYCNYVHSKEGGTHETTAQRALCEFFTREARKLDPNSKYEVTFDDCKKGLIAAINLRHIDPGYEGQTKTKVNNKDVLQSGKRGLNKALYQYFNNNNALLRRIITYLRQISRIRLESHKIKGITTKKQTTFLDDADLQLKFFNISDRNYSGYKEIIISEGDSALGALDNARNRKNQAVCAVMGVTDNIQGLTVTQMLQKSVYRDLITILGCGVGKDFDINKLKYNKIIIMTD